MTKKMLPEELKKKKEIGENCVIEKKEIISREGKKKRG